MKKNNLNLIKKLSIILMFIGIVFIIKDIKIVEASEFQYGWPISGNNAKETYIEYNYYGSNLTGPSEDGKYGREYIVDNNKWPSEIKYYAKNESHYGSDIVGLNGQTYQIISIVEGEVIATSGDRIINPSVNYIERNQRRTTAGLNDAGGYGNYVIIQENSTGRCFLYAHLKGGTITVKKGDKVSYGTNIALMGSSGDSGHPHLHFEIRTSKLSTIAENYNGRHYLLSTTERTTMDPAMFIGKSIYRGFQDLKSVSIKYEECREYVKYLYRTALKREASEFEASIWADVYTKNKSIAEITNGIILSQEANFFNLNNTEFSAKCYEIVLMRDMYSVEEMQGHIYRMDSGIWNRSDYINMLCSSEEFVKHRLPKFLNESIIIPGLARKEKLVKIGDLDGNGLLNAIDAVICLKIAEKSAQGIKIDDYILKIADIDKNGIVNKDDAMIMLKYYAASNLGSIDDSKISIEEFALNLKNQSKGGFTKAQN